MVFPTMPKRTNAPAIAPATTSPILSRRAAESRSICSSSPAEPTHPGLLALARELGRGAAREVLSGSTRDQSGTLEIVSSTVGALLLTTAAVLVVCRQAPLLF